MASDVFISYASADRSLAERLCRDLEADGLTCWIAPRNVPPGGDYASVIPDAIADSAILLLLFSAAAAATEHVEREVHLAGGRKIPILPLRLDATEPKGSLLFFLVNTQRIELFPRPETQFGRVRAEVRRLLEQQGVDRDRIQRVSPFRKVIATAVAWTIVLAVAVAVVGWLHAHWFNLIPSWRVPVVASTTRPAALLLVALVPLAALGLQYWSHRSLRRLATLDALFAIRGSRGAQLRTAGAAALLAGITLSTIVAPPPVSVALEERAIADVTRNYMQARPCMTGGSYVLQSRSHYAVRTRIGGGNPPGTYVLNVELAPYATSDGVELCEVWVDQRVGAMSVKFTAVMERPVYIITITDTFRDASDAGVVLFNLRHYRDSEPAPHTAIKAWLARDDFSSEVDHETVTKSIWAGD